MDPTDPASFTHESAKLSTGRTYHYIDQKPENYDPAHTLTMLCVHGFPDFWYGWRFQIGPWVRKGYRVIVPDMLGYGGTDKPESAEEYSTKKLCADLSALLDHIKVDRAIVLGHDWGAFVVGRFALWHPERLLALVILSIPYTPPRPNYLSLQEVVKHIPHYGYQLYFANSSSTAEIESKVSRFLGLMFGLIKMDRSFVYEGNLRGIVLDDKEEPGPSPKLTEEELKYYTEQLKNMNGPLSYYRTTKTRFDEEKAANLQGKFPDDLPVLYIWGTHDPTTSPESLKVSRAMIPKLKDVAIDGIGHWIMVDAKEEVVANVEGWLEELDLAVKAGSKL